MVEQEQAQGLGRGGLRRAPLGLALFGVAIAAARVPSQDGPVLGVDETRFSWVSAWGGLPEEEDYGKTNGGVAFDAAGNVYLNTDTERAVVVFDREGRFQRAWGKELAGGMHGMSLVEEGEQEFLYLTHTARHEVLKTTLEGALVWRLGWPEESGHYESEEQYRPTAIAVLPDGRFFVADGYGLSWIHEYDAERRWVRAFGGPGTGPGQFQTPHGMILDRRDGEHVLLICDRENQRLQTLSLEGESLGVHPGVRRPCGVARHGDWYAVAELEGRVTIMNSQLEVHARLGENPDPDKRAQHGVPREQWSAGHFLAPHGLDFDAAGNLFVVDWNATGRLSKLERLR